MEKLVIHCDNQQTIRLVSSELPQLKTTLYHVNIHNSWARERVRSGEISVAYLETTAMAADSLTKSLIRSKFRSFQQQLGLVTVPNFTD